MEFAVSLGLDTSDTSVQENFVMEGALIVENLSTSVHRDERNGNNMLDHTMSL